MGPREALIALAKSAERGGVVDAQALTTAQAAGYRISEFCRCRGADCKCRQPKEKADEPRVEK
ncbi:MAG: hypothetical protein HYY50_03050 [Candidatus Kerfeldbacteria bacterium]|nr:hypothetical protein [Candidatus Kerfeldbacteria bacterium]